MDLQTYALRRLKELLSTNELAKGLTPIRQSVFIEVMIRLHSLLQFLDKNKKRIVFKDDISPTKDIQDITDLVSKLRNAAVHDLTSGENIISGNGWFVFNTVAGHMPNAIKVNDSVMGCNYNDDVAYYYGQNRIYLKRHIYRLANEIEKSLQL